MNTQSSCFHFYLIITKEVCERFEKMLSKGQFQFGFWYANFPLNKQRGDDNYSKNYFGVAADRSSAQYCIEINHEKITIESEPFGISPIFYAEIMNELHISSNIHLLSNKLNTKVNLHINKRFILEQNLFNYSLFDNTLFTEIKLLPANSIAVITNKLTIDCKFQIQDYFCDNPVPINKCINNLVDLFLIQNSGKICDGDYLTFTSGFDGRSLLALALYEGKDIHTFAFGNSTNIDLSMPRQYSERLGIDFVPIFLDNADYIDNFLHIGKEVLKITGANSNLLQLHWPYAAKIIGEKSTTSVTGMFGSELFRAAHIAGQFVSPVLVDIFSNAEDRSWISKLKIATSLEFLNFNDFKEEIESLISEIEGYIKSILYLSINQRFYKYVFDETFRKFFGMQMIYPMREYITIVNPFLDWIFIKELLKTELAGVNNDFFTDNPLKRFKGQLFYAALLKRLNRNLYEFDTGKGYAPKDLHGWRGRLNITKSFVIKRLKRKYMINNLDNLGILSGIARNKSELHEKGMLSQFYNSDYLEHVFKSSNWKINENVRDDLIKTVSTSFYLSEIL